MSGLIFQGHLKKWPRLYAGLLAAVTALVLWCGGGWPGHVSAAMADGSLAGTGWQLVAFQSMDDSIGTQRPDDPTRYTMSLHGDGTVTMRLNCNHASGRWSVEPAGDGSSGRFELFPIAATHALCSSPGLDKNVLTHAPFIRSYLLKNGTLYLSLMADGGIYSWQPATGNPAMTGIPAFPENGGPRNWEVAGVTRGLNLREQPTTGSRVVSRYTAGTILDNLGCLWSDGRIWCDVQQLGGGPRGYVAATYLQPAISPDGSAATGPDDSALRAGQGIFDATGPLPCARYQGQPMGQCEFGVARAGGGYATVVIRHPDGFVRAIFFRMGKAIGADTSQADGYPEFRATRESDLHLIHVGKERYEIVDAVVLGG